MRTSWRNASLVASAAVVLALTTACGQDGGAAGGSQNVGASAQPGEIGTVGAGQGLGADAGDARSASPAAAGKLSVAADDELGELVTDGAGRTLYRFDADTAKPPKTTCEADCATAWPPVAADDAIAGEGIDESLLGEVTRADGTKQLTIGGWPAYRYAKDTAAGDVKGQGVNDKWFALAADGTKAARPGLSTRQDPDLGEIVVDKDGMTVYRFLKDVAWPDPVSACTGDCLKKWPVVAPVEADDTENVEKKGLMSFTRPDGAAQQTLDCWPLYTFAGDAEPGDINGQGVGGTWYAVAPDGKPVKK
ncbi:SCO0930 family lipoprotein [Streptomyces sp. JW3]|uniref:SCO0930 family lipoprotein n=1 Tax=Streptomyces sp. JW3 TaxID=3456955 RepID=UPI003FA441FD